MDLATLLKDYPLVIPAVAGLIGIILTFVFTRWNAERNRQWEKEDNDLNSRIESKKRKLENAHAYVDILFEAGRKLTQYEYTIINRNEVEKYEADYRNINDMLDTAISKAVSIPLLDDKDLRSLHVDFLRVLKAEFHYVETLQASIKNGDELYKEELMQRVREYNNKVGDAMREVYKRLDAVSKLPP